MQLPHICEYQTADLTLKLRPTDQITFLPVVVEEYAGGLSQLSVSYGKDLEANKDYILTITASTVAGNSSTTVTFSKYATQGDLQAVRKCEFATWTILQFIYSLQGPEVASVQS